MVMGKRSESVKKIYRFPLKQHIGAPAARAVAPGDNVVRGQLLAFREEETLGANIYSSVSGVVSEISETEIIMAYGSCSFASKVGALAGNHFLTIVEGRENLEKLGKDCLWKGAHDVVFEAYD